MTTPSSSCAWRLRGSTRVRKADRVPLSQARRFDPDRLIWLGHGDAEGGDCLSGGGELRHVRSTSVRFTTLTAQASWFIAPFDEQLACTMMVRVAAVKRPDQDICVEEQSQRSLSSASSCSR